MPLREGGILLRDALLLLLKVFGLWECQHYFSSAEFLGKWNCLQNLVSNMPQRRKDCPICSRRNLVKLSNHLADIHQLSGKTKRYYLSNAKSLGNQSESEEMSSRKRMRNESDEETLTVFNEDIFSSSDEEDGKSSEDIDGSDESESYGEMNESDDSDKADPWGVFIDKAA